MREFCFQKYSVDSIDLFRDDWAVRVCVKEFKLRQLDKGDDCYKNAAPTGRSNFLSSHWVSSHVPYHGR
jgi:hypothetical protein